MSLAEKLGNIHSRLNIALTDANSALVEKGAKASLDIGGIGDKIRTIESGGSNNLLNKLITREPIVNFTIPSDVDIIGDYAFYCFSHLEETVIPDNVISIGRSAFEECINMEGVTIGSGVTTIGTRAFYSCLAITSLTIPGSVTSIGTDAFWGCSKLTDIYFYPTTPPVVSFTQYSIPSTTTIHVPIGSGDAYKSATNWSTFADNIVEDIVIE